MSSKGPKDQSNKTSENFKDNMKPAEATRKPSVQIPKVPSAGNPALRAGFIGFGIAALCGAGAYYYFNYMKKPQQPKAFYEPSAQTKQDAKNFMDATSRLIADFSRQTKAIVEAGNNLQQEAHRAATNIKKQGERTINAFNKTYHDIKKEGEAIANVASKSAQQMKTQVQNVNAQLSQAGDSIKKQSKGFFSWGSSEKK